MKKILRIWKQYSYILLLAFILLGFFDLRFAIAAVICMAGPIILAFSKGRYWCGNLCPRGSFYDHLFSRISNKRKIPKFIKSKYFRLFMVIFVLSMFSYGIYQSRGNLYEIGMVFYRIILVTTVIGIMLSLFYNHRAWCNFCPMGTIAAFISKHRRSKKVLRISSSCVSCRLCEKKCPLEIVPYGYKGDLLSHPDCIQCGRCVNSCPRNAIGYHKE